MLSAGLRRYPKQIANAVYRSFERIMQERGRAYNNTADVSPYICTAAVTAGAALWLREGRTSVMLLVMVAAIIVSYLVHFRIQKQYIRVLARVVLFTATVLLYRAHPPQNQNTFIDSFVLDQCGELCFAEIVIRAWSRTAPRIHAGDDAARTNAITIMLAGVIFLVATNTYDEHIGRYFTPPFMVCLFLAIQNMRAYATPESRRTAKVGVGIALALSCLFGVLLF